MIFSKEEKREQATFYLSLKKGRAKKVACSFLCSGVTYGIYYSFEGKREQGEYQDIRGQENIGFGYTCN
jgi:hypothetical protein